MEAKTWLLQIKLEDIGNLQKELEKIIRLCEKHGPTLHYVIRGSGCIAKLCSKCLALHELNQAFDETHEQHEVK